MNLDIDHFVAALIPENLCQADLKRRSNFHKNRGGYLGKKGKLAITEKITGDNSRTLYVTNDYFMPVEAQIQLTQQKNVQSKPASHYASLFQLNQKLKWHKSSQLMPINPGLTAMPTNMV
ncbi:MAG: hypothetical protein HRU20_02980 [Pseudomonadales bacterium]|nr:hypothetical protein [Pseudomonadales bacterium]